MPTVMQRLIFTYHKTGTTLMQAVMTDVGEALGLRVQTLYGLVGRQDITAARSDIVLLPHSLLDFTPDWPYRAVRIVRDPRDIWVSGYHYHLRCQEDWCTGIYRHPLNREGSILWPAVDFHLQHRPEEWKRAYLASLNGHSYQTRLQALSRDAGMRFEMENATAWTMDSIRAWRPIDGCLDVKLEDIDIEFDHTMWLLFAALGLNQSQYQTAITIAQKHDIHRMTDDQIRSHRVVSSRQVSKWRDGLKPEQIGAFQGENGDVITKLGYDLLPLPGWAMSQECVLPYR
jgi:hypothetical protein